jgi:hypothetical protein
MTRLLTFIILLMACSSASAQITNGQINYELRIDQWRQNCDNDGLSNDDNEVRVGLNTDSNTGGTATWTSGGNGATCGGNQYVRRWQADAPSTVTNTNTLMYRCTGRANVANSFTVNHASWEEDGSPDCDPSGDACQSSGTWTMTFKSAAKTPCRFWAYNGTADAPSFVTGQNGDFSAKTVWRYTQGNGCGNALNFGTLASGTTYTHTNSNRTAPSGASADMGYTNVLGNTAPDVYYQFTISAPASLVISTVNAGTNYDNYLRLYNSGCGTQLAFNDDFGGTAQAQISTDLCAGTYIIMVEGFSTNAGDFNLTVLATTKPANGGAIAGITDGTVICNNADPGAFTNATNASGAGSLSYQWESSTTSASSGFSDIGLATSTTYDPGNLTSTTWFRRRVTDACSQVAYSNVIQVVMETTPPSISCPANISVNASSGTCGAVVTYTAPVGTDNCPGASTTQIAGLASGATFPVGNTTNTFRVTDSRGLTATCSFTVTVVDNQVPAITCPANITVNATTGTCGAVVTYTAPVGTDNCSGSSTVQTAGLASGATFPVGMTTNTFRVTDASGLQTTCSFTVTVNDVQAPVITCPANITVNATAGTCGAVVNYTAPVGTDNCPGVTTTRTTGLASGSTFPVGTTTNTFRAQDASGNIFICSFTVTVNDAEASAITCPANITVNATTGSCSAVVTYTTPVGTDNCSGASTVQTAGLASGATFPVGTTTNTFRVTDASGLQTTCSFTVTVNDAQLPSFSSFPANTTQGTDPSQCNAVVFYGDPVAADNCPGVTFTRIAGLASGSTFPIGLNTVTFRATDAAGNIFDRNLTVNIVDIASPQITCPANISINATAGTCGAVVNYTAPVGTDNCPGVSTAQLAGLASGATFPVGTTTNTFRATDAAGNIANCSFTVTVIDAQAPTISCPSNMNVSAGASCSPVVNYTAPVGTDNCSGASTTQIAGLPSGSNFPLGTTTNTFRVTDPAGNFTDCSFNVNVIDATPPSISVYAPTQTLCNATTVPDVIALMTYSDNCTATGSIIATQNPVAGAALALGNSSISVQLRDASNNTVNLNVPVQNAGTSTAPTSINGPSEICLGESATLTVSGGTLGALAVVEWYSSACGGTFLGNGTSITVSPSATETYFARYSNTCNTTTCASLTVQVLSATSNVTLASSSVTAVIVCEDGPWTYYRNPANTDEFVFAINWAPDGTLSAANSAAKAASSVELTVGPMVSATTSSYGTWVMGRYWNVNAPAFDEAVNVRFYYDPAEKLAVETAASSFVSASNNVINEGFLWFKTVSGPYTPASVNYNGVDVSNTIELTGTPGSDNGVTYVQFDALSSFSGGSGATGVGKGNALPLELLYFSGIKDGDVNRMSWSTGSEENTAYFEVERSKDGIQFTPVGRVAAAGNSTSTLLYSFNDMSPLSGVSYYRLRMVDLDGSQGYSNVISLERSVKGTDLVNLYPNPVTDLLNYELAAEYNDEVSIKILDNFGRTVHAELVLLSAGNNSRTISTSKLPAGLYYLSITCCEGKVITQKFVKD